MEHYLGLTVVNNEPGIIYKNKFVSLRHIPPSDKVRNDHLFVRHGRGYRVKPQVYARYGSQTEETPTEEKKKKKKINEEKNDDEEKEEEEEEEEEEKRENVSQLSSLVLRPRLQHKKSINSSESSPLVESKEWNEEAEVWIPRKNKSKSPEFKQFVESKEWNEDAEVWVPKGSKTLLVPKKKEEEEEKSEPYVKSDRIEGPVSLSEHRGLGKHIYLFGDVHVSKSTCSAAATSSSSTPPPIVLSKFLEQTLEANRDKTVDVFVESPFQTTNKNAKPPPPMEKRKSAANYLSQLRWDFRNCLVRNKKNCEWSKHVRFHYADPRDALLGEKYLFKGVKLHEVVRLAKKLQKRGEIRKSSTNFDSLWEKQVKLHPSRPFPWSAAYRSIYRPLIIATFSTLFSTIVHARYKLALGEWQFSLSSSSSSGTQENKKNTMQKKKHDDEKKKKKSQSSVPLKMNYRSK